MQDSDRQNQELLAEITRKEKIVAIRKEVITKDELIATKDRDLATKDEQIAAAVRNLATVQRELATKNEQQAKELAIKDEAIQQLEVYKCYLTKLLLNLINKLLQESRLREAQHGEALQQKDAEIRTLREELRKQHAARSVCNACWLYSV